ncbi:augmin subunit 6 [Tanacetum coccineum]|uniref:Augmin subunit 6 n=1 Tax=Tanacetum coccineum TaxID=301880 RepID=A0ABQ5EBP2_9ASTR
MYTNCLLLGVDLSIIGSNRVGLFRHSNSKLGEQLLYFILSSLRGPKAFDKVWLIFDSVRSSDFRKVVQKIITELESQGALPKSHSRLSSLANCYGPRFVELLWQLSLHALREVHRRTYAADVALNPLPASLTDVAFSHAATLLPVTKARIVMERRRFLKNAETVVQRQAMWSNLANEMTAQYRRLCAEEAYLQQELEKLHDLRNKVKMEGEPWDELVSSSSQNSHLVQRATRLWDSLLSRKSQHEVLALGPIKDLIAHREHRNLDKDQADRSLVIVNRENVNESLSTCHSQTNDEKSSWIDDRSGRGQPTVDIAEVLMRWNHALQRIHKPSLHLAKAYDGEGPDLVRSANDGGTSGHAELLAATLAQHRQYLASIQAYNENDYIRNFKKSVREAAFSTRSSNTAQSQDSHSGTGFSRVGTEKKAASLRSKQLFVPESQNCLVENCVSGGFKYNESLNTSRNFDMLLNDYDGVNGCISATASNYAESEGRLSFYDVEESHEPVFSPPFLMDASLSADSFKDLLAPLSETETAALMEH